MFETLLRLYQENRIGAEELSNAVIKKWITEEQKQHIMEGK